MWEPSLEQLFAAGTMHRWPDGRVTKLGIMEAGAVRLTTGRLVVCDPGWLQRDFSGFVATQLSPGVYPVELSVVHMPQNDPRLRSVLVTAARVLVSAAQVTAWEPAWPSEQEGVPARSFGVDGGQACFMDEAIAPFLIDYQADPSRVDLMVTQVLKEQWASIADESGRTVVVVSCGMGDGSYPVWLGHADDGSTAQVVVDLELLSHADGPVD